MNLLSTQEVAQYKKDAMNDIAAGLIPRYPMLPVSAGEIDGQDAYTRDQLCQIMGMLSWAMGMYAAQRAPGLNTKDEK